MGRSLRAKGISGLASLKQSLSKTSNTKKYAKLDKKEEIFGLPPKYLNYRYTDNDDGRIYYINENDTSNIAIFYIHGGAYYADFTPFHWLFIRKLIKRTNATIIAPSYHLAPFGTYKEAFNLIVPLYKEYVNSHPHKKIILMGDSAGGGLALSLAEHFKIEEIKLPHEIILLSPWVDVSMRNDEINAYILKDSFLDVESLKYVVQPWIGDVDACDWHVSPLYGNVEGINNITIFIGTREIFYPDVVKLFNKLDNNSFCELIIGDEMNHVYPLIPIPESKKALEKIVSIILQ